MSTYTISDHTAAEYTAMAEDCIRREQESWERSDTDGFLSQWASNSMARTYRTLARLAANGGDVQEITWLFTADGTPVDEWRWVEGKYGASTRVWHNKQVTWFRPSQAKKGERREAADRAKGFVFGTVAAKVIVKTVGNGYALSDVCVAANDNASDIVRVIEVGNYTDHKH